MQYVMSFHVPLQSMQVSYELVGKYVTVKVMLAVGLYDHCLQQLWTYLTVISAQFV